MAAAIFLKLIEDLSKEPFMEGYRYLKSSSMFKKETGDIRNTIEFRRWVDGLGHLVVEPSYCVRFGSITEWYKPFTPDRIAPVWNQYFNEGYSSDVKFYMSREFKSVSDSYFLDIIKKLERSAEGLNTMSKAGMFELALDGSNYTEMYPIIRDRIRYFSAYAFGRNDSLEHYFENNVLPRITGEKPFFKTSARWIFEYLAACKLVAPQMYQELKRKLVEHIPRMNHYLEDGRVIREPSVAEYDGRWEEIFDYLENTDIANLPKRRTKK